MGRLKNPTVCRMQGCKHNGKPQAGDDFRPHPHDKAGHRICSSCREIVRSGNSQDHLGIQASARSSATTATNEAAMPTTAASVLLGTSHTPKNAPVPAASVLLGPAHTPGNATVPGAARRPGESPLPSPAQDHRMGEWNVLETRRPAHTWTPSGLKALATFMAQNGATRLSIPATKEGRGCYDRSKKSLLSNAAWYVSGVASDMEQMIGRIIHRRVHQGGGSAAQSEAQRLGWLLRTKDQ